MHGWPCTSPWSRKIRNHSVDGRMQIWRETLQVPKTAAHSDLQEKTRYFPYAAYQSTLFIYSWIPVTIINFFIYFYFFYYYKLKRFFPSPFRPEKDSECHLLFALFFFFWGVLFCFSGPEAYCFRWLAAKSFRIFLSQLHNAGVPDTHSYAAILCGSWGC